MRSHGQDKLIFDIMSIIINWDKSSIEKFINDDNFETLYKFIESEISEINIEKIISSISLDKKLIVEIIISLCKYYVQNVGRSNIIINKTKELSEKAANEGFDWQNSIDSLDKVQEELLELKKEVLLDNTKNINEELGDLIFSILNFTRLSKISFIDSLNLANIKFQYRYEELKKILLKKGLKIKDLNDEQKLKYWEKAKKLSSKKFN